MSIRDVMFRIMVLVPAAPFLLLMLERRRDSATADGATGGFSGPDTTDNPSSSPISTVAGLAFGR